MVSVIIPTYNRREWLERAVASVRAQRFADWELIVVDDGSTDGTAEWVAALADGRIRCLRQARAGVSQARNRGVEAARYEWLAFLDSDDQWHPRKLERQLESLQTRPDFRMCHTDEVWIRRGVRVNPKRVHRKSGGWIYRRCLPICRVSPSSILIHQSLLRQVGGFDPRFPVCEDYELWLRLTCAHPIQFIREPLVVKFGGHSDQLSRSRWGLDRYRLSALIKICESGRLSYQQSVWTVREIVRKAGIVAGGFEKRGKASAARYYRALQERWTNSVPSAAGSWKP